MIELMTFNNHVENLLFKGKDDIKGSIRSILLPPLRGRFDGGIPLQHGQDSIAPVPALSRIKEY